MCFTLQTFSSECARTVRKVTTLKLLFSRFWKVARKRKQKQINNTGAKKKNWIGPTNFVRKTTFQVHSSRIKIVTISIFYISTLIIPLCLDCICRIQKTFNLKAKFSSRQRTNQIFHHFEIKCMASQSIKWYWGRSFKWSFFLLFLLNFPDIMLSFLDAITSLQRHISS